MATMSTPSMATEAVQNELKGPIKQATDSILGAYEALTKLEYDLKGLPDLAAKLTALKDSFRKKQWAARDTANLLMPSFEQLNTAILPIVSGSEGAIPPDEIQATVEQFVESTEDSRNLAQTLVPAFTKSQQRISDITISIDVTIKVQSVLVQNAKAQIDSLQQIRQRLQAMLKDIDASISELNNQIQKLKTEADKLGQSQDPEDKERLAELLQQIQAIQGQVSELQKNKKDIESQAQKVDADISSYTQKSKTAQAAIDSLTTAKASISNSGVAQKIGDIVAKVPVLLKVWHGMDDDCKALIRYANNQSEVPPIMTIFQKDGSVYNIVNEALGDLAVRVK